MSSMTAGDLEGVDYRDAVPGFLVRGGGFALMTAGLLTAGAGLQFLLFLATAGWLELVASAVLLTLGLLGAMVGPNLMMGRSWAAILGVPVALGMAAVVVPWGIYSTLFLFLSPLTWLAMLVSMVAVVAVMAAVPGSIKATRARNALYR